MTINTPPSLAGKINFAPAMFGPLPPVGGLTGQVVDVQPINACSPISNLSSAGLVIRGKIGALYSLAASDGTCGQIAVFLCFPSISVGICGPQLCAGI